MFLQKKLSHAESLVKPMAESKDRIENAVNIEKSKATKDIVSRWCESSVLGNLTTKNTSVQSEEKELKTIIISDLYYQLQGEFEGCKIAPGAFKELHQYLVESKFLQTYHHYDDDLFATSKDVYLFDIERLTAVDT
ncbi:hypothetical protein SO802_028095 [Lithocarpus litseifolius]|uniref:Uncharacterized protein n=1 Tax=Lithocarpus litseifolius TaxID=425828 RepID=A0AAW2BP92_9ROSI